jgi:hypothetical protein
MQIESPLDALHNAMAQAVITDLPDIRYWQRDWTEYRKLPKEKAANLSSGEGPGEWKTRRPSNSEVRVTMFHQVWGSTALGYGGIGGAAMTPAYTVIVNFNEVSCVYFANGPLAYTIDRRTQSIKGQAAFDEDVSKLNLAAASEAGKYL